MLSVAGAFENPAAGPALARLAAVQETGVLGIADCLVPGLHTELVQDVADMVLDRVLGDVELFSDFAGGAPVSDPLQDLDLAAGQGWPARRVEIAISEQVGDDLEEASSQGGRHHCS